MAVSGGCCIITLWLPALKKKSTISDKCASGYFCFVQNSCLFLKATLSCDFKAVFTLSLHLFFEVFVLGNDAQKSIQASHSGLPL